MTHIEQDLYRPNVGIMLVNARNEVFVGQRLDRFTDAWQMPQGGIDLGEILTMQFFVNSMRKPE